MRFGDGDTNTNWGLSFRFDGDSTQGSISVKDIHIGSTTYTRFVLNGNTCGEKKSNASGSRGCVTLEEGKLYLHTGSTFIQEGNRYNNEMILAEWDGKVTYSGSAGGTIYNANVFVDSCNYVWNESLSRCSAVTSYGYLGDTNVRHGRGRALAVALHGDEEILA